MWQRAAAATALVVLLSTVVVALEPSGGFSGLGSRTHQRFLQLTAELGLRVEQVTVSGRNHTDSKHILASVGVHRGDPILAVNPVQVRNRLERLDWIAEAKVSRLFPDAVHIEITERRPLALWQRDHRLTLIDRNGRPISDQMVSEAASLPLVVGDGAARHAARLLELLSAEPELYRRVRAAVRVGGRRWNLRLENGIEIRLPEQSPEIAWRRLAKLEREHNLLEKEVQTVDLRVPDRLVVQLTAAAADRRRNPGEDT